MQRGFSPGELRSLLSRTMAGADKKLAMMYARVRKHLAENSAGLVRVVWARIEAELLQRYGRLEQQLATCYSGISLSPSPEELRELFKSTG